MLIGDCWAFAHIPKCGGTALRSVLSGYEAGSIRPLGDRCPIASPLHDVMEHPGAFTVIRHPASWIASFWADQTPKRMGGGRYLHQFWADDLNTFARRLCRAHPGYVGELYDAYTRLCSAVYRLEDGLDNVAGVEAPVLNASDPDKYDPDTLRLIEQSEARCLGKYYQ